MVKVWVIPEKIGNGFDINKMKAIQIYGSKFNNHDFQ